MGARGKGQLLGKREVNCCFRTLGHSQLNTILTDTPVSGTIHLPSPLGNTVFSLGLATPLQLYLGGRTEFPLLPGFASPSPTPIPTEPPKVSSHGIINLTHLQHLFYLLQSEGSLWSPEGWSIAFTSNHFLVLSTPLD